MCHLMHEQIRKSIEHSEVSQSTNSSSYQIAQLLLLVHLLFRLYKVATLVNALEALLVPHQHDAATRSAP